MVETLDGNHNILFHNTDADYDMVTEDSDEDGISKITINFGSYPAFYIFGSQFKKIFPLISVCNGIVYMADVNAEIIDMWGDQANGKTFWLTREKGTGNFSEHVILFQGKLKRKMKDGTVMFNGDDITGQMRLDTVESLFNMPIEEGETLMAKISVKILKEQENN
jgi:hypothetical protein